LPYYYVNTPIAWPVIPAPSSITEIVIMARQSSAQLTIMIDAAFASRRASNRRAWVMKQQAFGGASAPVVFSIEALVYMGFLKGIAP
jgi:hypothetical protein